MPALITHRLFGEKSIDRLPEGLVSSDDERAAFLLANQGPDPFFFRFRTLNSSACMELGHVMHRARVSRQLAALRDGVTHLQAHDAGVGRAWTLGLLSHYVLDRTAHPFVYAQQWGIQEMDPDLADEGDKVHAVIETDLDVLMLQLKRDGATTADYPPVCELVTTDRINKVAGALTSFMANKVYGLKIGANEYGGAVADMQLVYRLIEPAGSPCTEVAVRIEGLRGKYSLFQALAHPVTAELPAATGNLNCHTWKNPFTGAESSESFPALFERALDDYGMTAARFIETGNMEAVTGHRNYSGRPLDASEECDVED